MPYDSLTFGLALIGYALLAADAARRFVGRRSTALTWATAAIVTAHVICVWALRFDWSVTRMWQKSAFGFLLFHTAFAAIAASVLASRRRRDQLVMVAFVVVSAGAIPAPFRYTEIAMLRLPVPAVFVAATIWSVLARRGKIGRD